MKEKYRNESSLQPLSVAHEAQASLWWQVSKWWVSKWQIINKQCHLHVHTVEVMGRVFCKMASIKLNLASISESQSEGQLWTTQENAWSHNCTHQTTKHNSPCPPPQLLHVTMNFNTKLHSMHIHVHLSSPHWARTQTDSTWFQLKSISNPLRTNARLEEDSPKSIQFRLRLCGWN